MSGSSKCATRRCEFVFTSSVRRARDQSPLAFACSSAILPRRASISRAALWASSSSFLVCLVFDARLSWASASSSCPTEPFHALASTEALRTHLDGGGLFRIEIQILFELRYLRSGLLAQAIGVEVDAAANEHQCKKRKRRLHHGTQGSQGRSFRSVHLVAKAPGHNMRDGDRMRNEGFRQGFRAFSF